MTCEEDGDGEHLFWPGAREQVLRFADEGRLTTFLVACARCHAGFDLLAEELERRRQLRLRPP